MNMPPVARILDLFHAFKPIFEALAMAKVSTSAEEARGLGFPPPRRSISMNGDRLVADAKDHRARSGARGVPRKSAAAHRAFIRVLGEELMAGAKLAIHMHAARRIHLRIRRPRRPQTRPRPGRRRAQRTAIVSEQYMLDLERETFVSLCGERKTQERIAHTLKTGKPLRN